MKKFDINNYKGRYAMHCNTARKSEQFRIYLSSTGRCWTDGASYREIDYWNTFKENLVYYFNEGTCGSSDWTQNSQDYTILEFDDFIWEDFCSYEVGDVVELKNEDRFFIINEKYGINPGGSINLNDYYATGENKCDFRSSIVKVYKIDTSLKLADIFDIFHEKNLSLVWECPGSRIFHGQTLEHWHREMWNWLADNPNKTKCEWIKSQDFTLYEIALLRHFDDCFACMASATFSDSMYGTRCSHCPLCEKKKGDSCLNGLYWNFVHSKGFERAQAAHDIANLEWKER